MVWSRTLTSLSQPSRSINLLAAVIETIALSGWDFSFAWIS
jgi:hypothetical protein